MRFKMVLAALAAIMFSVPSIAGGYKTAGYQKTIVDVAASDENFSTLVTAIKAADLGETLSSEGPFTVFAPTNAAFEKLPAGTLQSLLKPENRDQLRSILTYHVIPGKVLSRDIAGKAMSVASVQGDEIDIDAKSGVRVDEASVITADLMASNGVIHVIDTVILPN